MTLSKSSNHGSSLRWYVVTSVPLCFQSSVDKLLGRSTARCFFHNLLQSESLSHFIMSDSWLCFWNLRVELHQNECILLFCCTNNVYFKACADVGWSMMWASQETRTPILISTLGALLQTHLLITLPLCGQKRERPWRLFCFFFF